MRLMIALLLTAGLLLPQALANEGGGEGGNETTVQPGSGAKTRKKSNCDELARYKRELDYFQEKLDTFRRQLDDARAELEKVRTTTDPGKPGRVKKAEREVRAQAGAVKGSSERRDEAKAKYERLRRACL